MRALLVALLAVSGALAGCLAQEVPAVTPGSLDGLLSQPLLTGLLAEATPIESFDGTILDAWTFRPDTDEPVPVIINFSPYWHNLAPPTAEGGDAYSQYLIDYFVPRGYAVALVSARGTGLSEGCFTIGGPLELQDEDVVATFFGTQPWSNGNVTATGKSYDGTMAQGLLTMANPHVKTIVPVAPISELYKYNYYGGVPYGNGVGTNMFNTLYVLGVSVTQGTSPYRLEAPDPSDPTWEKVATRFCDESVEVQTAQYHSVLTGDYSPYWQARNYTALLPERVDASVFYVHGLQDWNVKPDHMTPWIEELRARGVPVKMWLGQWAHDYAHRDDWNQTLLRWLDHHLKGIDTGILQEPMVQVQDDAGVWRDEPEWPPARAGRTLLYPTEDGTLGPEPGTGDAQYLDAPPSSALFLTLFEAELPEGARIVGSPVFHALVSASGPRATLSVMLLVDGKVVDEGFLDLTHRDSMESGTPMEPGTEYAVRVPLFPQDLVVPPGGRVMLAFGHDSPGPAGATPAPTGALVTVRFGEGTFLELPTLPLGDAAIEDPQPVDLGCWAC